MDTLNTPGTGTGTVSGIALKITCYSAFAIIDLGVRQDNEAPWCHEAILFDPSGTEAKAAVRNLRRSVKLGDLVSCEGAWELSKEKHKIGPSRRLRLFSMPTCITMRHCDAASVAQIKHEVGFKQKLNSPQPRKKRKRNESAGGSGGEAESASSSTSSVTQASCGHSSTTNARDRCEIFVKFILSKLSLAQLNLGSGVVDVAGGGGHVSLAFCLAGVKSTVVDPRDSCGMLPKRDRKAYRRAIKHSSLVLQFDMHRAWFGGRISGSDNTFSGGSDEPDSIPSCGTKGGDNNVTSNVLMKGCSAIVAMHPDEATEAAVDWSLEHGRPFFVVPCCVFARLFPHRTQGKRKVETQEEFVEYLMNKHPQAQIEILNFDGANKCVYFLGSDTTAAANTTAANTTASANTTAHVV